MKRMCRVLLVLALFGLALPAQAYYDDVHFALTYYIARQVGYTPEQAYRVANANLSVDYAYPTEPVQGSNFYDFLASLGGQASSQGPRWQFHSFRNEIKFANALSDSAQAIKADAMINERQVFLWNQALTNRNPGVFLHFLQDKEPHARYGSAFGHWGIVYQSTIARAGENKLPLGGSTDWLDFRGEESNLQLARITFEALKRYMKIVAPEQTTRSFDPNEFTEVLRALRAANLAPPALKGKVLDALKHQKLGTELGLSKDVIGRTGNAGNIFLPSSGTDPSIELAPPEIADIFKHLDGPDLAAAVRIVNAEMARRRWPLNGDWADGTSSYETLPPVPGEVNRYPLDRDGKLADDSQTNRYVLAGTLTLRVRRAGGTDAADGSAQVSIRLAASLSDHQGVALVDPRTMAVNGAALSFEQLPIGDLIIEVASAGQAPVSERYLMRKQVETYTFVLPAAAEPAATSALPAELDSEHDRLNELLARLRGQRDQAVQRFDAALAATRGQLALRQKAAVGARTPPAGVDPNAAATLCARIDSADQILATALAKIEAEQAQIEPALRQALQLASRCSGPSDVSAAEGKLRQAQDLAHRIDQQATALALLAVQVEALQQQRQQLLQQSGGAGSPPIAAGAGAAVDFSALDAAWSELQDVDRAWSAAAAERERSAVDRLATAIATAPLAQQATLRTVLTRLNSVLDQIAVLGLEPHHLQQRAAQVADLRARANAAQSPVEDDERFIEMPDSSADACLERPPTDIGAGMDQADTSRALAQLALDKLGAAVTAQLQVCRQQLDNPPIDPIAAVAAKNCRYPDSEPYWDEGEQRAMCRCPVGWQWNADRSACVENREAQLAAAVSSVACARFANTEPTWSDTDNKVVCSCIDGTQFVPDGQSCAPDQATQLAQQRCSAPHSEPYWNTQTESPGCRCQTNYVYSEIFQECEIDWRAQVKAADCSAYENSEAYWDAQSGGTACRCVSGYKSDPVARTCTPDVSTQLADADCSAWPNSTPRWDPAKNEVQCQCNTGFRFNDRSQACEQDIDTMLAATDCSEWPNSAPLWDPGKREIRCECVDGTRFNSATQRCEREFSAAEQVAALNCSIYPNSEAYWNRDENQPRCRCRPGYQVGLYSTLCEAEAEAEAVVVACNTASKSGANPPETITVDIGSSSGTARLDYEMFQVADQMIVEYGGQVVADTGCVSGASSVSLDLGGYSNQVIIRVNPNCRGSDDTMWRFTVTCPE